VGSVPRGRTLAPAKPNPFGVQSEESFVEEDNHDKLFAEDPGYQDRFLCCKSGLSEGFAFSYVHVWCLQRATNTYCLEACKGVRVVLAVSTIAGGNQVYQPATSISRQLMLAGCQFPLSVGKAASKAQTTGPSRVHRNTAKLAYQMQFPAGAEAVCM
jgi:hypothetical protein